MSTKYDPITILDLLPTAEDLMALAHGSTVGDPAVVAPGVHQGRNPDSRDVQGLTKRFVRDKAIKRDLQWFQRQLDRLLLPGGNVFDLPPSRRARIPKDDQDPSRGKRPIDVPAEMKRLFCLHVRRQIEQWIEKSLHSGQMGGRPAEYISPICTRKGATGQDHLATAIWLALIALGPESVVLLLDLKNAFGLLPKQAVIKQLHTLGLSNQAAKWVWRLAC